jgi:hypothetical protein
MDTKYSHLRKEGNTSRIDKWSIDNLRDGFNYFFELNGHYPTSRDVDNFEYLPTRKTLERSFGGITKLRETLGLDIPKDYRTGIMRSNVAANADKRARKYEEEFYKYLTSKIPEIRVHEHKIIRPGDTAADFFIYTSDTAGIVIDLFYAMDIYSLLGIINIKFKKYVNVKFPVYFVLVGNEDITQEIIDDKMNNRKNQLSSHIQVLTEENFKKSLNYLTQLQKYE